MTFPHFRPRSVPFFVHFAVLFWFADPARVLAADTGIDNGIGSGVEGTATLAPVRIEGSATEILQYDPIVPAQKEKVSGTSGSGALQRDFSDKLPLPVTDSGTPGARSQFRGLGRSADETNVQTLGVPLNTAQGGGFDFASFPQFIWSDYQFSAGPQQGAYDPRAAAGTMTLVPWTSEAIRRDAPHFRVTQNISHALSQTAVGGAVNGFGALVGYSGFDSKGVTGSAGARLLRADRDSRFDATLQFLGTSIDSKIPGMIQYPSPGAVQTYHRYLPVLELGHDSAKQVREKLTVYYDHNRVKYDDPHGYSTDDLSQQLGLEAAVVRESWTFGATARHTEYHQENGFTAPGENFYHLTTSKVFDTGSWVFDPQLQLDEVSTRPVYLGGSLGARWDFDAHQAVFARIGYAPRFATLVDRFYSLPPAYGFPGTEGNPALAPERNVTLVAGHDGHWRSLTTRTQFFAQFKNDLFSSAPLANVANTSTTVNAGSGHSLVLQLDVTYEALSWLSLQDSLALSQSKVESTGQPFPYLPKLTNLVSAWAHDGDSRDWRVGGVFRWVNDVTYTATGSLLPSYTLLNLEARKRLLKWQRAAGAVSVDAVARLENALDQHVQVTYGYEMPRQLWSFLLSATL